jgi:hypothetical protein
MIWLGNYFFLWKKNFFFFFFLFIFYLFIYLFIYFLEKNLFHCFDFFFFFFLIYIINLSRWLYDSWSGDQNLMEKKKFFFLLTCFLLFFKLKWNEEKRFFFDISVVRTPRRFFFLTTILLLWTVTWKNYNNELLQFLFFFGPWLHQTKILENKNSLSIYQPVFFFKEIISLSKKKKLFRSKPIELLCNILYSV